ncbi:hypothetical protein HDV00_003460 [Rhizophlyctis rosea]|nr:hypothetical protein HDV00_003460 [Rhizophlyctis rosea]
MFPATPDSIATSFRDYFNPATPAERPVENEAQTSTSMPADESDNDSSWNRVEFNSITDFRTAISTPGHPLASIEHLLPDELVEILMASPKFPELKSRSSDDLVNESAEEHVKLERKYAKLTQLRSKERYWNERLERAVNWLEKENAKLDRELEIQQRRTPVDTSIFEKSAGAE